MRENFVYTALQLPVLPELLRRHKLRAGETVPRILCFILLLCGAISVSAESKLMRYSDRPEVRGFINDLAVEHQFNRAELMALFRDVQHQRQVIEAYAKPAERALSWAEYRPIFVTDSRTRQGVAFWQEHAEVLARAEAETGVPAEIIVAIIGVETRFGGHKGRNPVLDSLVTLAFDREQRKDFFRRELKEFLLLCREQGFDPRKIKGSYAGAMGMPQFISSSYRSYAIDFDGDKVVDLFNSIDDVIGSVANYFKRHGWEAGESVISRARVEGDLTEEAVGRGRKGLKPSKTLAEYRELGVEPHDSLPEDEKLVLMYFDGKEGDEYWLGRKNFYVITRYNHSTMYALAAYQLSQQIKQAYQQSK